MQCGFAWGHLERLDLRRVPSSKILEPPLTDVGMLKLPVTVGGNAGSHSGISFS